MTPTERRRREVELAEATDELSRHVRALGHLATAELNIANIRKESRGQYECGITFGCSALREELHSKIEACERTARILRDSLREVR